MALIMCPECKNQISDSAEACPKCGYKLTPEKVNEIKKKGQQLQKGCAIGCLSVFAIFALLFIIGSFSSNSKKTETPKTKDEIRKEQIKNCFSVWDGSCPGLTDYIKKTMNDPDSYKHVKTVYEDKGDYLLVKTTFRGKNAFGGIVVNWVMAKVALNGNVIAVISQGS
ncbi:MAG: hypothetical protein A2252_04545 [Elusimicrobia bacterium RIFOXYA2_FULL_39_19]|nr:MAG: hypothetical protein A2252_04545 [Elusimicrobia bacterium RIFOXYA2_FULL_39_19]